VRAHSEEVTRELLEALATYERQRPGRGAAFLEAVEVVFARIRQAPLSFPRVAFMRRPVVRRAKILTFPYSVIYYVHRGVPVVVAIAHGRRAANYWRKRLR
jgi:hypothetical protein